MRIVTRALVIGGSQGHRDKQDKICDVLRGLRNSGEEIAGIFGEMGFKMCVLEGSLSAKGCKDKRYYLPCDRADCKEGRG